MVEAKLLKIPTDNLTENLTKNLQLIDRRGDNLY